MSKTTIKATIVSILGFSAASLKVQLSTTDEGADEPKTSEVHVKAGLAFVVPLEVEMDADLFNTEEVLDLTITQDDTYMLEVKLITEDVQKPVALSGDAGAPAKAPEGLAKTIAAKRAAAGQGCSYAERTPYTF